MIKCLTRAVFVNRRARPVEGTACQDHARVTMHCAFCSEEIVSMPVKQEGEMFCSLECANMASGIESEEPEGYYEEDEIEGLLEEDE